MLKRITKHILNVVSLLGVALLLSSCMSVMSIGSRFDKGAIVRPYQVTCQNASNLGDVFSNDDMTRGLAGMYFPLFLFELPFSIITDTLMLPWDLWDLQYEKTERKTFQSYTNHFLPSDFKNTSGWVTSKDGLLSLRIASNEKMYDIEERVYISIELMNNSNQKILTYKLFNTFPHCSNAIIISGDNKIVYQGPVGDILSYPEEITNKESAFEVMAINIEDWKGFNSKGEFTISYTYSSHKTETDKDLWIGQIKSQPIKIMRE